MLTIYYKCCLSISTLYYNFSKPRGTPAYAYIMDGTDMVQSDTSSSTSWKRILGNEQCDHCLRPMCQWSINQDTRETATWFILFADTTPMYQILGSRPVPNYRKFLNGICNKANLTNYISNYIVENVLLLSVHSFSRGQLTGHLYVWWTF